MLLGVKKRISNQLSRKQTIKIQKQRMKKNIWILSYSLLCKMLKTKLRKEKFMLMMGCNILIIEIYGFKFNFV